MRSTATDLGNCFDHVHTSDSCEVFGRQDYGDKYLFSTCTSSLFVATVGMLPDCFDHVHTSDSCEVFGRQDYVDKYLFSTCSLSVTKFSDLFAETSKLYAASIMTKYERLHVWIDPGGFAARKL